MPRFSLTQLTLRVLLARRTDLSWALVALAVLAVASSSPAPSARNSSLGAADEATRLRQNGAYEQAASLYREALSRAGAASEELALGAAEAYLAAGQSSDALQLADLALRANPGSSDAHLLRGQALAKLGQTDAALQAFSRSMDGDPVGGYAAFLGGEVLEAQSDPSRAREWYARAVEAGLAPLWEVAALRRIGESFMPEEPVPAASWFDRASARASDLEEQGPPVWYDGELSRRASEDRQPAILLRRANALQTADRMQAAITTYRQLVNTYPAATESGSALDALSGLGEYFGVDAYTRGRVLLAQGNPDDAEIAFTAALNEGSAPRGGAPAYYYRGVARRDSGDLDGAIADFNRVAKQFPNDSLAPEAAWLAARWTELTRGMDDGITAYQALTDAFPASPRAGQALARAGWLQSQQGDGEAARDSWARLGNLPDPQARAQGLFWLGRSLLGMGRTDGAISALDQAQQAAPLSYEGLRARDLKSTANTREPYVGTWASHLALANDQDPVACHGWIDTWANPAEAEPSPDASLKRINRLLRLGLQGPASAEVLAVQSALGPHRLLDLALALNQAGLYPVSIALANSLSARSPASTLEDAPGCLQRLVYPLAYRELVEQEGNRYGLDPYLLLGLLRQESWFGARAESSAAALGLTQIIPSTARDIARSLDQASFSQQDLLRPTTSIAFGARYLSDQYQRFGRRPLLALAAYNAGPGNVSRWNGGDVRVDADDFVQNIDFIETRTYVRTIYETYGHYRALYG